MNTEKMVSLPSKKDKLLGLLGGPLVNVNFRSGSPDGLAKDIANAKMKDPHLYEKIKRLAKSKPLASLAVGVIERADIKIVSSKLEEGMDPTLALELYHWSVVQLDITEKIISLSSDANSPLGIAISAHCILNKDNYIAAKLNLIDSVELDGGKKVHEKVDDEEKKFEELEEKKRYIKMRNGYDERIERGGDEVGLAKKWVEKFALSVRAAIEAPRLVGNGSIWSGEYDIDWVRIRGKIVHLN